MKKFGRTTKRESFFHEEFCGVRSATDEQMAREKRESSGEMFLDFMVYSGLEAEAEVVSRIRVRQDFVQVILSHLSDFVEADLESSGIFKLVSSPDIN